MSFPAVTPEAWRAQVEKELAGAPFEKLVQKTPEGLAIAPLYMEAPSTPLHVSAPLVRPFQICMRYASDADLDGAEALWLPKEADHAALLERQDLARMTLVVEGDLTRAQALFPIAARVVLLPDADELDAVARVVASHHEALTMMVSTLPYVDAGADAADELAIALSTGARYLSALLEAGMSVKDAAARLAVQVTADRDTFLSLAKIRALRTCWQKLLAASGATEAPRTLVHAVSAARTLTVRDPWVNMLRVTTQMFAAILGGADLVTPATFDDVLGAPSDHGRHVARNTGLVLREESFLGKVVDPAAGSYYLETITDGLARAAWTRFQTLEREGGIAEALKNGHLAAKLERSWRARLDAIAKRKLPILGVSEFAHLGETLPANLQPSSTGEADLQGGSHPDHVALPRHRDAEAFEALRSRADIQKPEAILVALGELAESRARASFAAGFFSAGGIRTRETTADEKARIACICGTDARYATEAATHARALKAAGCERVLVAGRPGALETELRAAGVDGFIFVGCDVVAMLGELLGARGAA